MVLLFENRKKGKHGIPTSVPGWCSEAWLSWDFPCRFSDKDCSVWGWDCSVVFSVVYTTTCVNMWVVQCPLTDNSISYFSQGFQSSWVQDLKECHAVVAELTGSERNRKRWQSIFEINTWTLADKKPCQKKDGARAKSLRHWLLPCRLPMRNSGLS